jgi:hypothetical protein
VQDPSPIALEPGGVLFLRRFVRDKAKVPVARAMTAADFSEGSFSLRRSSTFEDAIARSFEHVGPLWALTNSRRWLTSRSVVHYSVSDNDWTDKVTSLIERARLIIVVADTGSSMRWELEQALAASGRRPLLVVVPPITDAAWFRWRADWAALRTEFPQLPDIEADSAAVHFEGGDPPRILRAASASLESKEIAIQAYAERWRPPPAAPVVGSGYACGNCYARQSAAGTCVHCGFDVVPLAMPGVVEVLQTEAVRWHDRRARIESMLVVVPSVLVGYALQGYVAERLEPRVSIPSHPGPIVALGSGLATVVIGGTYLLLCRLFYRRSALLIAFGYAKHPSKLSANELLDWMRCRIHGRLRRSRRI